MNLEINPNIKLSDFENKEVRLCYVAQYPSGMKLYALKSDDVALAIADQDIDDLVALAKNPSLQFKLMSNEIHEEWWI